MASEYVVLSRWAFALWWFALLVMHTLAAGYNTAYALFYLELNGTYLNTVLEFQFLGMPAPYHRRIAAAYAVMSALHGVCLLLMVIGSLWHRSLRFTLVPAWVNLRIAPTNTKRSHDTTWIKRVSASVYHKLIDRNGLFGVDSAHFHRVLIVREVVETLLQSIQAYRMSAVLPRVSVNRFFVTLLVLNCFAPLVVHRVFKHNEPRKRFANLMCDCFLDLVVSIGIPMLIVLSYVGQYDPWIEGFPTELWYDDDWSARVQNEFQLVLVVSWSDLFSRIVFSWGLLSTSTSIKELLAHSASVRQVAVAPTIVDITKATNVGPTSACTRVLPTSPTASGVLRATATAPMKMALAPEKPRQQFQLKLAYYAFMTWGIVVLGLHIHAETRPMLPQCLLQVRPWARDRPSCYLADLNCHRLGIEGMKAQVHEQWSTFDGTMVVNLLIRHCPALEIPSILQDFANLNAFKVYNSTLVEWGSDAAVTGKHHPKLITVYLVRVNMTDGEIPPGLLSRDFPPMLIDFEIVVSNLRSLPDDIDQIWPLGSSVYIEFGNLTSVPASMIRLQSYYLSVCGNPITELPAELFEVDNLIYLHAGSTLVSELPRNVTRLSSALAFFFVTQTNVSTFWSWIDPLVERSAIDARILAGGSPYCNELEHFRATGNTSDFAVTSRAAEPSPYSVLMDLEQNAAAINAVLLCQEVYAAPLYPLAADDRNLALVPVAMPTRPMS